VITVTEEAKRHLHTVNADVRLREGSVFRLDRAMSGPYREGLIVVSVDEPREGDQPVEYEGEDILHISEAVSSAHDGCLLDLEETTEGAAFILIGLPKAESRLR
jgi:Fe-S cluster assembly iron-binding protein IscA